MFHATVSAEMTHGHKPTGELSTNDMPASEFNREQALENLKTALAEFEIEGVESNIPFLQYLIEQPEFAAAQINVKWIESSVLPGFLSSTENEG